MKVILKYLRDILPIEKIAAGEWIDLRCGEDIFIQANEYKQIPLGVAMQLPVGYEAHIIPRSSTFRKYGVLLANSYGLIDNSYCGDADEWTFPAYAVRDTVVPKNERICQFRIVRIQPEIEFEIAETLGNPNRGGLGSTGRI